YQIRLKNDVMSKVIPHVVSGELKPIVDNVFSWTDIIKAHQYMEANSTIGTGGD
ncbi:hypothetical protein HDU96_001242, partial [Phlyctochytrium bullatum]